MINSVQYDARCVLCRTLGEGVVPRASKGPEWVGERVEEYNEYVRRRHRFLVSHPFVERRFRELRRVRNLIRQRSSLDRTIYDRTILYRLRFRERRLHHTLEDFLEEHIGPSPWDSP